jgi:hypothetical protein
MACEANQIFFSACCIFWLAVLNWLPIPCSAMIHTLAIHVTDTDICRCILKKLPVCGRYKIKYNKYAINLMKCSWFCCRHGSPTPSQGSSQGVPVTSCLAAASIKPTSTVELTPSLANYYDEKLIGHVCGWQGALIERQVRRIKGVLG